MNWHVGNMIWLPQRSQAECRIILLVLFLTAVESIQPTIQVRCGNLSCIQHLRRSLNLARFTNKTSVELLQTYKSINGDSMDLICDMQMDNVPVSTISGQSISERILSVYTHLREFLPHLKTVMEQQKDFEPTTNPVVDELKNMIVHVDRVCQIVNCLLQILQPNIPIPEPAQRPTGIPPAQNTFQQKVYGCIVLSRLQEFLSQAFHELKSLRGKRSRRRTKKQ